MGVESARSAHRPVAPHIAQEFLLGEHPGRLGDQRTEEAELLIGEGDLGAPIGDAPRRRIENQLTDPPRALDRSRATAQEIRDPQEQLVVMDGLTAIRFSPALVSRGWAWP